MMMMSGDGGKCSNKKDKAMKQKREAGRKHCKAVVKDEEETKREIK